MIIFIIILLLIVSLIIIHAIKQNKQEEIDQFNEINPIEIAGLYQNRKNIKKLVDEYAIEGLLDMPGELIVDGREDKNPGTIRIECGGLIVGYIPKKLTNKVEPFLSRIRSADVTITYDEYPNDPKRINIEGDIDISLL